MEIDKFIILGLFEGIPTVDDMITKVKISDLIGNTLVLENGEKRTISDELRNIMIKANDETEFFTLQGRLKPLESSPYVIKYPESRMNQKVAFGYRLRKALTYIGIGGLKVKDIIESGRFELIRHIMAEKHITLEQACQIPYRELHESIYGRVQNTKTYTYLYTKILNET